MPSTPPACINLAASARVLLMERFFKVTNRPFVLKSVLNAFLIGRFVQEQEVSHIHFSDARHFDLMLGAGRIFYRDGATNLNVQKRSQPL